MGLSAITHKHLLLCEGMHDVQFFYHLQKDRGLPAFQAASCGNIVGTPSGRDGITHLTGALNALPAIPAFHTTLQKILIIADNDNNPKGAFQRVQQLVKNTAELRPGVRYTVPASEQATSGRNPSITVLMLPWSGQQGALDTLCLAAASYRRSW